MKGASVFKRYHNHPKDTAKEFTKDKWYMTNDMVEFVPSDGKDGYDGAYKILGNLNVDLIKSVPHCLLLDSKKTRILFQKFNYPHLAMFGESTL